MLEDRFVVESPVGQGGMAVIYSARDRRTQQKVAVKLLHAGTRSQFILEHFLREAELLASLKHPHIVSYIAHGQLPGASAYLAMEWLEGEDLAQRLQRGPLRLGETLRLAELLADALAAIHRCGIVHRGLSRGPAKAGLSVGKSCAAGLLKRRIGSAAETAQSARGFLSRCRFHHYDTLR